VNKIEQEESENIFQLIKNNIISNKNNNHFDIEIKNSRQMFEKRLNSSKNRLNHEEGNSKSDNQIQTSQMISVSRLAKTPDRNVRGFSSQKIDLIGDSEKITIKKNDISFNNYAKQDILNNSRNKSIIKKNSLNNNSNKSNHSKEQKIFDLIQSEQLAADKSMRSLDVPINKSMSVSNYNMDLSYKEVSKEDENSFQLSENNMLRMSNSLFEEVKNNNSNNIQNKSLKSGKNSVF